MQGALTWDRTTLIPKEIIMPENAMQFYTNIYIKKNNRIIRDCKMTKC